MTMKYNFDNFILNFITVNVNFENNQQISNNNGCDLLT